MMKTLLTLFVLLFSSSVLAEDISDFEIEGISVGDSLLDYFSERQIINNKQHYYKNGCYHDVLMMELLAEAWKEKNDKFGKYISIFE